MRIYFIIHYANGAIQKGYSLEDWQSMPDEGVLVVTEFFDRSYGHPPKQCGHRHAGRDYYWMASDGGIGAGSAKQIPENVHIKRGQYVDDVIWEKIYNAACVDQLWEER